MTLRVAEDALQRRAILYDKGGDRHYDTISAWIKSTRGSDPDASLLYLAEMLEGGEDPRFIARRMVILASEDIGNADPRALEVAVAAAHAVEHVGLPECALNLAQAAVYLSLAPKSNASYEALGRRAGWVRDHGAPAPPPPLRSSDGEGTTTRTTPEGVAEQELMPPRRGRALPRADRARRGGEIDAQHGAEAGRRLVGRARSSSWHSRSTCSTTGGDAHAPRSACSDRRDPRERLGRCAR